MTVKPLSSVPPQSPRRGRGQLQKLLDRWRERPNAEPGFGLPEVFGELSRLVGRTLPQSSPGRGLSPPASAPERRSAPAARSPPTSTISPGKSTPTPKPTPIEPPMNPEPYPFGYALAYPPAIFACGNGSRSNLLAKSACCQYP